MLPFGQAWTRSLIHRRSDTIRRKSDWLLSPHSSHFKAYDIVPKADLKSQCFILSWNISVLCYTFKTQDTGQSRRFSCVVRMVDPVRYRHFRKIKRTDRVKTGHVYGMS